MTVGRDCGLAIVAGYERSNSEFCGHHCHSKVDFKPEFIAGHGHEVIIASCSFEFQQLQQKEAKEMQSALLGDLASTAETLHANTEKEVALL